MAILARGVFVAEGQAPPESDNAAPSIAPVLLNFDLVSNTAPIGSNQALVFDVTPYLAPNTGPVGQNQVMEFDITKPI